MEKIMSFSWSGVTIAVEKGDDGLYYVTQSDTDYSHYNIKIQKYTLSEAMEYVADAIDKVRTEN